MPWNLGAKSNGTVDFSGNSKIVAEGAVVFNNENNGKNMKIGFIYKLKGFFILMRKLAQFPVLGNNLQF